MMNDIEDYEGSISLEEAGWLEDAEDDDPFDAEYEKIFSEDEDVTEDVQRAYEHDPVTGQKAQRPKISKLNQSKLSRRELDELFLEH